MRKQNFYLLFALIFVFLLVLVACGNGLSMIALPFVLIANGLRRLSLSGTTGNVIAVGLFILCGLLPSLLLRRRKKLCEILLVLAICGMQIYTLYFMINPGLRPFLLKGESGDVILSGSVYWLLFLLWVLGFLQRTDVMSPDNIYGVLRVFLGICAAVLLLIGIAGGFADLISDIRRLRADNTAEGLNLIPTICFYILSYCAGGIEFAFDTSIILLLITLLKELERDPYSQNCCDIAEKIVQRCKYALIAIVMSSCILIVGQLLFASRLYSLKAVFRIPVMSIAIVFGVMGISRLLCQGRQLKEDNDLFI